MSDTAYRPYWLCNLFINPLAPPTSAAYGAAIVVNGNKYHAHEMCLGIHRAASKRVEWAGRLSEIVRQP
jgi:hypothetical protein